LSEWVYSVLLHLHVENLYLRGIELLEHAIPVFGYIEGQEPSFAAFAALFAFAVVAAINCGGILATRSVREGFLLILILFRSQK
jgi:hypothetical protein